MGPASGMLRGTGAGVIAAALVALAPVLPAALGDGPEGTQPPAPPAQVQPLPQEPPPAAEIPPTPPPEESAPVVVEEPAPVVVEEPAPVVDEPAPVVEEPAPVVVEEPAPVVEEPAPVVEEPAPVVEEPASADPQPEPAPAPVDANQTFKSFKGTPAAEDPHVAASLTKAAVQAQRSEPAAAPQWVASDDSVLGTFTGSEAVAIPEPDVLADVATARAGVLPHRSASRPATGALVAVPTNPAAGPPRANHRPVVAPRRWVPAAAPATAATTPAASATPSPAATRPARPAKSRDHKEKGLLAVPAVVFNALADSVAFVPPVVWGALGGVALAALALLAFAVARHRKARALGRERVALLADIETLEGAVVPALPEALGGLALSVTSNPATGPVAGGDFHDAFPLSRDRVAVIVGDVAGNGRQVLADAQLVRHAVRAYLEAGLDPRAAIAMTGAVVDDRDEPLFASVLVAVHDRRTGTLTYASAGHEPPLFVSAQGAGLPPVTGWSPPLGAGLETGRRQTSVPLPEGTAVCLVTDGVTEARAGGERIGVSRVIKWLSALGPGAMSSDVVARLRAEAEPDDDVTVCMLRALTPTTAHAPRIEEAIVEGGDPTVLVRFLRDCGLPLEDAEEAGAALAAAPDGTRMVASVEIRGGRAMVELAPLRGASTTETLVS